VGKPQVVYRETIEKEAAATAVFDKEVAGQRHYAEVCVNLKPLSRGSGNRFILNIAEGSIPTQFMKAIEKGVMESLESGTLMGYPAVDIEASLVGGAYRDSQGTDLAYKVSASMACKDALTRGVPFCWTRSWMWRSLFRNHLRAM